MSAALVLHVIALAMLAIGGAFYFKGRTQAAREHTVARLEEVAFSPNVLATPQAASRLVPSRWVTEILLRSGVSLRPRYAAWVAGVFLLVAAAAWFVAGGALAFILMGISVAGAAVLFSARRRRLRARLRSQLPGFLDSVLRAVVTGRSFESAIGAACEYSSLPLRGVFEAVLGRVRLGEDLGSALDDARRMYRLHELALLRLVVVLGQRYGSSVTDPLGTISAMVRQREQFQREVHALTGEVRLSSWIMGLLPLGLTLYILAANPGYLMMMWNDPSGRSALVVAGLMQVVGAVAIWRLAKSVT
jgi:tight adherence protein B